MFCEIHGCLVDFRGCPECSIENSSPSQIENGCENCGHINFFENKEGLLSCKECKLEHELIPDMDGHVRKSYTSIYELFQRNSFYPYFWVKERTTGEIIFVIDIHEKETGISKWRISDGVFIAKFDHSGKEIPIFRTTRKDTRSKGGKRYRPYISGGYSTAGVDNSTLPKNFGFMFGEENDEDWREIERPFKEVHINSTIEDLVEQAFTRYHNTNNRFHNNSGEEMASEKQKAFLMSDKLSYQGDVEKLTKRQAGKIITRKTGRR